MEYLEFGAMNSNIVLAAEGTPERMTAGFSAARRSIEAGEGRFSRFLADSELNQLNRAAGQWFCASPEMYEILKLAQDYFYQTGGLFDPSILPALKRAGYNRSMEEIRLYGVDRTPQTLKRADSSFGEVRFEPQACQIWMPQGMEIDLGGIAKGWLASKAAAILSGYCAACAVNAGGDMVLVGLPAEQDKWELALEDPRDPDGTLAVLKVGPGAVATSSVMKRSWQQDGKRQHHLIDPRSGEPAVTDWLSVTVITPRATTAEVYAKVLLLAGPLQAMEIISNHQEIAFIAVDRQGKLWGSKTSEEYMNVNG
jgi:thiamine biosynthesis lipoprotein